MNEFEWLNKAKEKIAILASGTTFEVKDLFDSLEWANLSAKERQGFGKYFSITCKNGQINNIHRVEEGKRKPNRYVKE